jgi:hypothetical protein
VSELLDAESIRELLRQLGERLDRRGIHAELYVVGGTAMVLAYDRSRVTRDVDAITDQQDVVEAEARAMSLEREHLASDWLNGRVRPMLPRVLDDGRLEAFNAPGISVTVASPTHMLAMKVRAARGERDIEDIVLLCEILGVVSIAEVLSVADSVWGVGMVREENVFLVSQALTARGFSA